MDWHAARRYLRASWLNLRLKASRFPRLLAGLASGALFLVLVLKASPGDGGGMHSGASASDLSQIDALLAWLRSNGAELHPCLTVAPCGSGGGRCVMATCLIRKSEKLLSIPRSVQLHPLYVHGAAKPPCPQLEQWLEEPVAEGGGAGFHLSIHSMRLALRLLEERAQGRQSFWAAYMPTVPPSFSSVLWDEAEQQRCLADTSGFAFNKISRRFARYAAERTLLRRCQARGVSRLADDTLLHWAMHAVGSRSYESYEAGRDGNTKETFAVMVPLADMFNDDPSHNAQWGWDASNHAFEVSAITDMSPGSEILVSYGQKSNEQLLTHYGFIHPHNPHDIVQIDLLDPDSAAMAMRRLSLLLSYNTELAVSRLPASLGELRVSLRQEATGDLQGKDLETQVLSRILQYCERAASQWGGGEVAAGTDAACGGYRADLATLAQSCVAFAKAATLEVSMAHGESNASAAVDAQLSTSEGVVATFGRQLLLAWRADLR